MLMVSSYGQHCAKLNAPVNLIYSEADFEVFRSAGATRCTDGGEIWQGSVPNFTPSVQQLRYRTPKTEIFTKI